MGYNGAMRIGRFLFALLLTFFLFSGTVSTIHAQAETKRCGINIDPANPAGFPGGDKMKGIGWARVVFQSTGGYGAYDPVIDSLNAAGVNVLINLNQQTYWGDGPNNWNSGDFNAYAQAFAGKTAEIAAHYGSKVAAYEIWNEPDGTGPQFAHLDPGQLGTLATASTPGLHRAGAKVVLGGFVGGSDQIANYLKQMPGAVESADAVSGHPYTLQPNSPELHNYLNTVTGFGKPFWITEFSTGNTDNGQASSDYIKNMYEDLNTNYGAKVPVAIWFAWSDAMEAPGTSFGITDRSGNPKQPVFDTFFKDGCSASVPSTITPPTIGGIYVYPGIDDQKTFDSQIKMASTYMMTCASPHAFSGKIENEDAINKPSDENYVSYNLQCPGGPGDTSCLIPQVAGTLYINHEQTTIPLFRFDRGSALNPASTTRRFNDLEDFFGTRYTSTPQDFINGTLANGVTHKLTGDIAKCLQTVTFLNSIKKACEAPPPPQSFINNPPSKDLTSLSKTAPPEGERCALDEMIPDLKKSYLNVLDGYNGLSNTEKTAVCGATPANSSRDFLNNVRRTQNELNAVERITPKAYKPAYLIRYINLPECGPNETTGVCAGNDNLIGKFQNWFSPASDSDSNKTKNRIFITKVYVPAGVATTPDDKSNALAGANTSYVSPLMGSMQAIIPQSQQDHYSELKSNQIDEIENLTRTIGVNPEPAIDTRTPDTSKFVNCPECNDNDQDLIALFIKRINADISRQHQGDEYNPDCQMPDLAGETAAVHKTSINPVGNTDPVHEISINAIATLRAKQTPHGPEVRVRTFFFLPEEYRNVSNYEDALAKTFLPQSLQNTLVFADKKINDGKADQTYRYLQLSDTAPKFGRNGLTIHVSSTPQEGATVGYFINKVTDNSTGKTATTPGKDLKLKGSIVGEDLDTFNINPQVPGGKLARGLWDIMCKVTQPFQAGKVPAQYKGFENFLERGPSACFTDAPTTAPKPPAVLATFSEYFNTLKDILKTATNPVPPGSCGLTYVTAADAVKYGEELKRSLPNQIKRVSGFAGWEAYFQGYYPGQTQQLFAACGGDPKCYNFVIDTAVNTPICNADTRLNPYIAIAIALNETGGLKNEPGKNSNQHFGCTMAIFDKYRDGGNAVSTDGLQCTVKTADGRQVINPLIGPPMSQADVNACVDVEGGAVPTWANSRFDTTVEDGLACMIGRFNAYCQPSNGALNDVDALLAYGYHGTGGIIGTIMRYLLLGNTSEYNEFVSRCGI